MVMTITAAGKNQILKQTRNKLIISTRKTAFAALSFNP